MLGIAQSNIQIVDAFEWSQVYNNIIIRVTRTPRSSRDQKIETEVINGMNMRYDSHANVTIYLSLGFKHICMLSLNVVPCTKVY